MDIGESKVAEKDSVKKKVMREQGKWLPVMTWRDPSPALLEIRKVVLHRLPR